MIFKLAAATCWEKAYDDYYGSIQFDVKDALRDAFKMTTYEIYSAKMSGDLKIYQIGRAHV